MKNQMRIYVTIGENVGEWLDLPMDSDELQEALDEIGEGCKVQGSENLPFNVENFKNKPISDINELCQEIEDLPRHIDDNVIEAILDHCSTFEDGISVLQNGSFTDYTHCKTIEDVAMEYIDMSGLFHNVPDNFIRYFDFEKYAEENFNDLIECGNGYIELHE